MAVDDIAGGGDVVWEQAISKLKQRFTFGHWEVGKGKFCSREVVQAADGYMRVGQPAYIKSLDFRAPRESEERTTRICQRERDLSQSCRVVLTRPRLAKAHTDLALPVSQIPVDQLCFVSYGDVIGGSTRAEQAQAVYVIMFADRASLEGMAGPVTLVSWRSHRVKRVVASASAAEAMGLSEAIALGDWVRALWSEVVVGLSLREWREQENVPAPHFGH